MRIETQKVPKRISVTSLKEVVYAFCYEYPQYTYDEALALPYKRIIAMLKMAQKKNADHYFNLLQIQMAAQSGKDAKKLLTHYKGLADV